MNSIARPAGEIDRGSSGRLPGGRLRFYRANAKASGVAVQFELKINRTPEDRYNCFFLEMAPQKSPAAVGNRGRAAATFDWENKVTVKLGFQDVCQFLAVLEGQTDKVGEQGNGLYHESGDSNTLISFGRNTGDGGGYGLGLSRKRKDGSQLFKGRMLLSAAEAIGLKHVFQAGLFYMAFLPNIQRD